jgi:hypothetical protein
MLVAEKNVPTGLGPWPRSGRWPWWWRWRGAARRKRSRYSGTSWFFPCSWGLATRDLVVLICEVQQLFLWLDEVWRVPKFSWPLWIPQAFLRPRRHKPRRRGFFFLKPHCLSSIARGRWGTQMPLTIATTTKKNDSMFLLYIRFILLHSIIFWKRSQLRWNGLPWTKLVLR